MGLAQAIKFYEHYKKHDFDYAICSALKRSYQTIEPFITSQMIPHERTALINEISWGIHEGQRGTPEMRDRYLAMVTAWAEGDFDASLPEAESARQLASRLNRFLDYLILLPYQRILICTHGRTLRCLLCLMKNQHLREMENYDHANTGLFLSHFDGEKFRLITENDTRHL
jgi:probable phosphoglycerate mutase